MYNITWKYLVLIGVTTANIVDPDQTAPRGTV